jgi:hypothetical protein
VHLRDALSNIKMTTTIETFNPAALSRSDSISAPLTANKTVATSSTKSSKLNSTLQRIDFEPLYIDLKALIGHNWGTYHDALTKFIQGLSPLNHTPTDL